MLKIKKEVTIQQLKDMGFEVGATIEGGCDWSEVFMDDRFNEVFNWEIPNFSIFWGWRIIEITDDGDNDAALDLLFDLIQKGMVEKA